MTYPPGQPGDHGQGHSGSYQPPQQPYPQAQYQQPPYQQPPYQQLPYPQPPYPQPLYPQPAPGIAVAATVLCTLTSLCVVWSTISLMAGNPFVVHFGSPAPMWATVLNLVWSIGDILLIIGTIFLWSRSALGRILAAVGLCLVLASVVGFEVAAASMPDLVVRLWTWSIDFFAVLALAFVLLPATGTYLRSGRRTQYPPSA